MVVYMKVYWPLLLIRVVRHAALSCLCPYIRRKNNVIFYAIADPTLHQVSH
jgi:hypothetical protein